MDVTKINFELVAPEFISLLKTCEFYAVDQEMTGIACKDLTDNAGMDASETYHPKRAAACRYTAFQFGCALFHKVGENCYECRPFNFFLRSDRGDTVLEMSAIDFNCSNKMDFQKWLYEGISYCNAEREEKITSDFFPRPREDLPEEEEQWLSNMMKTLQDQFHGKTVGSDACYTSTEKHQGPRTDYLLYQRLVEAKLFLSVDPPLNTGFPSWKRKKTTFTLIPQEIFDAVHKADIQKKVNVINSKLAFRKIMKALIECRKPQIGHNYFSDLLFLYNQHINSLPTSYPEYKESLHNHFPEIYDTKIFANAAKSYLPGGLDFCSTALEPLFNTLAVDFSTDVEIRFPLGFQNYHPSATALANKCLTATAAAHHAAYDAYMTGVVYLRIRALAGASQIAKFKNQIAIFGCVYSMSLDGDDVLDPQSTFFHVKFARSMSTEDIVNLFKTTEEIDQEEKLKKQQEDSPAGSTVRKRTRTAGGIWLKYINDASGIVVINPAKPIGEVQSVFEARVKELKWEEKVQLKGFKEWQKMKRLVPGGS